MHHALWNLFSYLRRILCFLRALWISLFFPAHISSLLFFFVFLNISFRFSFLAKSSQRCQPLSCHLSPSRGCGAGVIRIHMAPPRGESLDAPAPARQNFLFMEVRKAGNTSFSATTSFEGWKKHSEQNCGYQIMSNSISGFTCSWEQSGTLWTLWLIIPDNFVLSLFFIFIHFFPFHFFHYFNYIYIWP